jgi:hypothetical protein
MMAVTTGISNAIRGVVRAIQNGSHDRPPRARRGEVSEKIVCKCGAKMSNYSRYFNDEKKYYCCTKCANVRIDHDGKSVWGTRRIEMEKQEG